METISQMRLSTFFLLQLQLLLLPLLLIKAATSEPSTTTCQTRCGNITIPYPFGIGPPGCFRPGFNLTCNQSSTSGPKLFLGDGTLEVTDILLKQGQVLIKSNVASLYCTPEDPVQDSKIISWSGIRKGGPYTFSRDRNTFITISCGVISYITSFDNYNTSASSLCASVCLSDSSDYYEKGCSGIGCCFTNLGAEAYKLTVRVVSIMNQTLLSSNGSCTKAFLVDRVVWFDALMPKNNYIGDKVPTVLDWAIIEGKSSFCIFARNNMTTFACRSKNSYCSNAFDQGGYRCNCLHGFEGNPYVTNGCKDIDECEAYVNPCLGGSAGVCVNTIGSYLCNCPQGKHKILAGDPTHVCIKIKSPTYIGLIISIGGGAGLVLLILLVTTFLLYKRLEQINIKKHRMRCFCRNHGRLLQQLLTSIEDDVERTKIFGLEEIEKATNNFDVTRILGRGGHGTVYKGILSDQRVVAIKKSDIEHQREIEQFINEVAILSQINHRNVVKLFGCCLETEVPLLVYEFISGGTLSDHLHVSGNHVSSLSFKDRLRIATEVAGALAYLHSSASISIFHRDIKSSNILLDHNNTAKVSDFGASRSIPSERTHLTTTVQGTFGYLDPEYYHTGQLTEKSDVYSFGIILVELLTGERAISHALLRQEKNLAMHFICSLKENQLFDIIDARVAEEGRKEELEAVAMLAETCLRLKGEERPTMKKVEQKLNQLDAIKRQKHYRWGSQEQKYDESEGTITNALSGCNTNDETRLYSLEKEFMISQSYPR